MLIICAYIARPKGVRCGNIISLRSSFSCLLSFLFLFGLGDLLIIFLFLDGKSFFFFSIFYVKRMKSVVCPFRLIVIDCQENSLSLFFCFSSLFEFFGRVVFSRCVTGKLYNSTKQKNLKTVAHEFRIVHTTVCNDGCIGPRRLGRSVE